MSRIIIQYHTPTPTIYIYLLAILFNISTNIPRAEACARALTGIYAPQLRFVGSRPSRAVFLGGYKLYKRESPAKVDQK